MFEKQSLLELKKNPSIFKNEMLEDTIYYQRKYHFDIGTGKHATWNNEADAFKHAYMQAYLSLIKGSIISFSAGIEHELKNPKQPHDELIMDLHNNLQGLKIANEIKKNYDVNKLKNTNKKILKDVVAQMVIERMQSGKLILEPSGRIKPKRPLFLQLNKYKKSNITGYAANIEQNEKNNIDTYGINNEELTQYAFENKLFAPENRVFYDGEINPAKIPFGSSEDKYVPQLLEQFESNNKKLPSEKELKQRVNNGELIYVHNYTRSDGTQVSGYYRHKQ